MLRKLFGLGERKSLTINQLVSGRMFGGSLRPGLDHEAIAANSVIGACMDVLTSATAMAPLIAEKQKGDAWEETESELLNLILNPVTGVAGYEQSFARLMWGLTWSDRTDGNAYLRIVRSISTQAIGLQYVPHTAVGVQPDNLGGVRSYSVSMGTGTMEIAPADMIHITAGIDPRNPVMGISPLKSAMREVLTDNEIAVYTHAVLMKPFPSTFLSMENDLDMSDEQKAQFDAKLKSMFSGEGRAGWMFTNQEIKVTNSGFKPNEMALDRLSDRPEERVCAVLGVPPIMANMGAGLDKSTYSNYEEAKRAFYDTTVSGVWRRIESALNDQLIRKAGRPAEKGVRFRFDTRGIKALAESEDGLAARAEKLFRGNVVSRGEARQMIGLDATPEDFETYAYMLGPGALSLGGAKVRVAAESNV